MCDNFFDSAVVFEVLSFWGVIRCWELLSCDLWKILNLEEIHFAKRFKLTLNSFFLYNTFHLIIVAKYCMKVSKKDYKHKYSNAEHHIRLLNGSMKALKCSPFMIFTEIIENLLWICIRLQVSSHIKVYDFL